jgi:hypothetical protein
MDPIIFGQLNEAYHKGVYVQEETLSEEEYLDIQEWVEALIEEGYDLDQYSDEELYEAYMKEAFISPYKGKTSYNNPQGHSPATKADLRSKKLQETEPGSARQIKQTRRASHLAKMFKAGRDTMREEIDLYDLVSEYLVSEGFCDSYEDADVIMANMSEEWREGIIEEVLDEATVRSVTSPEGKDKYKSPTYSPTEKEDIETQREIRTGMSRKRQKGLRQLERGNSKADERELNRMMKQGEREKRKARRSSFNIMNSKGPSGGGRDEYRYSEVPTDFRARKRRERGL